MKYMGIDYGSKRIGIAVSDENGTLAFPKETMQNSSMFLKELLALIDKENINEIIVGKSLDQDGKRNIIMDDIDAFVEQLERLSGKIVRLEDERFTSHFMRTFDFTKSVEKPISRNRTKKTPTKGLDSLAAAGILQRFLDGRK